MLQLASWLRLSPTVVELALNARQLTPQALLLLERAVASGALAALESVHIVDEHQLLDVQGRLRSAAACHGGRVRIVSSTSLDASQVLGSDAWRPGQAHGADEPQQVCASAHDVPMPAAAAGPRDRDRDLMRSAEGGVQVGPSRFSWLRTGVGWGGLSSGGLPTVQAPRSAPRPAAQSNSRQGCRPAQCGSSCAAPAAAG